ncbi:helicase-related protein [Knoellia sp. 3-2P3]|uniref:helicase-related protein n=1 Tax=unclassified Knoellia TaxID=2618719 RepID=UPI0023DBEDB8|nr:helicase-related protein [Knoellia sp. 3-2P3]MDF2092592.1 helicase-related protein [Knoellia sp. 3-2P3]
MSTSESESNLERAYAKLEDLVPGVGVLGITGDGPVQVVTTRWHGSNFITLTYQHADGRTDQTVLGRDHEPRLTLQRTGRTRAFDGEAEAWRLAAEALRIRYAALFDPMLAITTSDLQPLPHQIKAVYGELLPRTPLRFLLADDPGAGKTIMCGLYVKELILRGDLARCMIVAPGSLVDQWVDELYDKFGLRFEILTKSLVDASLDGNPFDEHPLLIARMDQLSRNEELQARLERSDWDLVVVDEAHRMSAHYFGTELKKTRRYELGELLGRVSRHLLLMTATPHAGKQEDFQLFLALLDGDRFEGKFRDGVHSVQPQDLMRRMVKEELLTMEGKPLFPERRAYTVPYDLSDDEQSLYEAVTQYVREEMNRADRLKQEGEGRRGNTVGFALTVLQRRLASSPEAILRSLERRKARLEKRRREMVGGGSGDRSFRQRVDELLNRDEQDIDEDLEDLSSEEVEALEEDVVDAATAARTVAELEHEIGDLADLAEIARQVRHSGTDRKWSELRDILTDNDLTREADGSLRKVIIFTEHRDTLNYLLDRIRTLVGRDEAVVAIHGGVGREERRATQERFTQDPDVRVLVATDAAGEGLNLQRAHLMVNYDLPWNPNKIEQRFGRIHRIGQTEVCHLWNLVANNTREGEVFIRLLEKIEEQRKAYAGKVFDVLGDAFENQPLRTLLIKAIQYGDRPEVRAELDRVIDERVGEGLDELLAERALHREVIAEGDVEQMRLRLEEAQARRLQPHFIESFFLEAFGRLGGRVSRREAGRYEVTHVPQAVRDRDRVIGVGGPVLARYERVTFQRERVRGQGMPLAHLVAPGHPLLDAVVDLTIERHHANLKHGVVLVDAADPGETPRLLVALTEEITNGRQPALTVSKRFDFVELQPDERMRHAGPAPYLDYDPLADDAESLIEPVLDQPWLERGAEDVAIGWAIEHSLQDHEAAVRARVIPAVQRTREEVVRRLSAEINYWDTRHAELLDQEAAGRTLKIRPETAFRRARALEGRLERRRNELDADERLSVRPPVVAGAALVIPQGLLERLRGQRDQPASSYARETRFVERRAVEAVMAAERSLGRVPHEMEHNHPGYDIRSVASDGSVVRIEVKGRVEGADDFTITHNEVLTAKNLGDEYRLALVRVSDTGPADDEVRYLARPFDDTGTNDFRITKLVLNWSRTWAQGREPH